MSIYAGEKKKGGGGGGPQARTIRAIRGKQDYGAISTSLTRMNPYGTVVCCSGRPAGQVWLAQCAKHNQHESPKLPSK